ncbi:MAG: hypothetical protein ACR2JX_03385 [Mycobacteriales bacterium]
MSALLSHSPSTARAEVFSGGASFVNSGDNAKPLPPSEVHDVELWRDAWRLMDKHQPAHDPDDTCVTCGLSWPCEPYWRGQANVIASRSRF